MSFSFLHTADWHIGKSFGNFSSEQQPLLRQARLDAIARIAHAARHRGAGHVLVCGDVFDHPGLADRVINQALAAMAAQSGVIWHLLPGNHDPALDGGIWQRLSGIGLPANVRVHERPEPVEIAPGVVLLAAPLTAKAIAHDPTTWMDGAATPAGTIRIGVAHGSTQEFGSTRRASIGIAPMRRVAARLDYLALGDWHGVKEIATGIWYSGTPEPDQFPSNAPGYALAVEIAGAGAVPKVTPVATAKYRWVKRRITVRDSTDLAPLEAEIMALGTTAAEHLFEVTLEGIVGLADDAQIRDRLFKLDHSLFSLHQRLDGLRLDAGGDVIETIGDVEIKGVAMRLSAMRADPGPETLLIVEDALRRLFQMVRSSEDAR